MEVWSADHLKEMHDRELAAQKALLTAELKRIDADVAELHLELSRRLASAERVSDDRLTSLRELIESASKERERAFEKFEATVTARFVQVNEFRGSLDDLGKTMATRRELETALQGVKTETLTALNAAKVTTDELRDQLAELRSRVDVGPQDLRTLQARSDEYVGASTRGQQINASVVGWVSIFVLGLSVLIGLLASHTI